MRLLFYYICGSLIWLLMLSAMLATRELTYQLMVNYVTLTAGIALGFLGKDHLEKRPWLLLFVPSLPLVLGIFI